ncbi:hypothetical protein ACFORH_38780 [Amycolatopsis roodepoortensis]|uniref:Holin n=1 Tax=Amycolatopsis roodepoortensis TaxID=700274 RepID=A0ABR9L1I2_9PSEU|nr:hypothetical protein [Amycolatopsis roodepoortensis]MBE1574487.1 hypothetical protein [Amycolatopsis roodepoortensis]
MNAKPTRTQAAVAVLGACSVGAQVVAGASNGITAWQLTWMLAAMITFAGGAIAAAPSKKSL